VFVKFRLFSAFTLTVAIATSAFAATPPLFGSCDSNGECSAVFIRTLPEAKALCGDRPASVAWRKDSTLLLLQCIGSGTDREDSTSYLINGSGIVGLNYGRYVKISFMKQNPTTPIPDKFGTVPVCAPANVDKLRTSTFVLLDKRPGDSTTPYCYDVTYLITTGDSVQLDTNVGTVQTTDKSYFAERISARTRQHVERLVQIFRMWHDRQQPN